MTAPSSWFLVAEDRALAPGDVTRRELGGRPLTLWRSRSGSVVLHDAACPHLGADLGGGCVGQMGIVCPFHGLAFDDHGRCHAPDGRPPPSARLRPLPLAERHGLWFAWSGPEAPTFELPVVDRPDRRFVLRSFEFPGHPERVSENSVDHAHFGPVHGYHDFTVLDAPALDGPALRARYGFRRRLPWGWHRLEIGVRVCGLGYSEVEVLDRASRSTLRLLVLPTPRTDRVVRLTLALAVDGIGGRRLPGWLAALVARAVMPQYAHDVEQDIAVWSTQQPLARPALAASDGPIGRYRRWARQFDQEAA